MTDVARLGVEVDSSSVKKGAVDLKTLATQSGKTEQAVKGLGQEAGRSARAAGALGASAGASAGGLNAGAQAATRYARSTRGAALQNANLTAQFNDIGVMLAAGQNPIMLAMQQGTQINQVFDQMGGGAKAVRGLGPAFMSMVSPVNLATIATIAGGAALVQWGLGALGAGANAVTFEDRVENLTSAVKDYTEATELAEGSTDDLGQRFGSASEAARDVFGILAGVADIEALQEFDGILGEVLTRLPLIRSSLGQNGDLAILDNSMSRNFLADALGIERSFFAFSQSARDARDATDELLSDMIRASETLRTAGGTDARIDALQEVLRIYTSLAEQSDGLSAQESEMIGLMGNSIIQMREFAATSADAAADMDEALTIVEGNRLRAEALMTEAMRARHAEANRFAQQTMAQSVSDVRSAQEMLSVLQQQNNLRQLEVNYGRNSVQATEARVQAEVAAVAAQLESLDIAESLRDAILEAAEYGAELANTDVGAGLAGAVSASAQLARNLGISLESAQLLDGIRNPATEGDRRRGILGFESGDPRGGGGNIWTGPTRTATRWTPTTAEAARGAGGGRSGAQEQTAAMQMAEQAIRQAERAAVDFAEVQAILDERLSSGALTTEQYDIAIEELSEQFANTSGLESFEQHISSISDALADAIVNGENLGDALRSTFRQIAAEWISNGIQNIFTTMLSGGGRGNGGGGGLLGRLFAGFFDGGGHIPSGQVGMVGERGPEIVSGPANVISRADTARMMGGSQSLNVTVTMDQSTGALGAVVADIAGRVLAQAKPSLVQEAAAAGHSTTIRSLQQTRRGVNY